MHKERSCKIMIQLTRLFKFKSNRIPNLEAHLVIEYEFFNLTTKEEIFLKFK